MDSCHWGCCWAAALAVVTNNPSTLLFNICLFIKPQLLQRILCTGARFRALDCEWGLDRRAPLPQGLAWNTSVQAEYFQIVSQVLMFYAAVNVEGWLSQMAVAEQVSWKAPLKRGESRERSEGMAAAFQARHAQAATHVHFSSGCTWPLLEIKVSLTTWGLKTIIIWTKKRHSFANECVTHSWFWACCLAYLCLSFSLLQSLSC